MTTHNTVDSEVARFLDRAAAVAPVVRTHVEESEAACRLSKPVVDALRDAGVFRMAMPKAWGGPELGVSRQVEIVEYLARVDGSAAWCAAIGSESGFYASYLDDAVARQLFPSLDTVIAGFAAPAGRLQVCEGGYRLSGRWPFGSGINHADVVMGGVMVIGEDGEPQLLPDGRPDWRVAMLPASRWRILDTWDATGLAGSGSHDYAIDNAFVPREQTIRLGRRGRPEPLYAWVGLAPSAAIGVPLGVAAEAFDIARALIAGKTSRATMRPAGQDPATLTGLGRAGALVGSARSYVFDVLGELTATVEAGDPPSLDQRARWAGCVVNTMTACREAVELLVDLVGAPALARGSELGRRLRDTSMLAQHGLAHRRVLQWSGGLYLGQHPPTPVY